MPETDVKLPEASEQETCASFACAVSELEVLRSGPAACVDLGKTPNVGSKKDFGKLFLPL